MGLRPLHRRAEVVKNLFHRPRALCILVIARPYLQVFWIGGFGGPGYSLVAGAKEGCSWSARVNAATPSCWAAESFLRLREMVTGDRLPIPCRTGSQSKSAATSKRARKRLVPNPRSPTARVQVARRVEFQYQCRQGRPRIFHPPRHVF